MPEVLLPVMGFLLPLPNKWSSSRILTLVCAFLGPFLVPAEEIKFPRSRPWNADEFASDSLRKYFQGLPERKLGKQDSEV